MTKPFAASAAGRRWLSLWTALVTLLFAGSAFAQVQRGPMPVLGLRAPDGEDEAAAVATASLRRTAARAGFTVPDNTPALEQLIAAFGCDDAVPVECLRQIATHINSPRFLYGSVRRAGRRRETAPVRLEVILFDTATGQPTPPSQTELPRAQAVDEDRWHAATEQVLRAILPAQPATANTGNGAGNGTGNGTGNGNVVTPPPGPAQPGAPIRRYIGYGAIGVGAVVGIVGAVVGATGYFGLTGQINSDADASRMGGLRSAPQDVQYFNDLYPTDTQTGQSVSGDAICGSLDNPSTLRYIGAQSNRDAALAGARNVCNSRSSTVTTMGALVGVGAAVLVAGVVLVVTDNTPSAAPTATATVNTTAAARSQHNLRAQWTLSPVVNQQTQGAVFNLRF